MAIIVELFEWSGRKKLHQWPWPSLRWPSFCMAKRDRGWLVHLLPKYYTIVLMELRAQVHIKWLVKSNFTMLWGSWLELESESTFWFIGGSRIFLGGGQTPKIRQIWGTWIESNWTDGVCWIKIGIGAVRTCTSLIQWK